jgi:SAM-dependent methyltransferase
MTIGPPNLIRKLHTVEEFLERYASDEYFVLDIGSGAATYMERSIRMDIQQKSGVQVCADAENLPFQNGTFDIVVLSAVLQYCHHPHKVVAEAHRVLRVDGYVYVDVPFIQPYCFDTPDLYRFTRDGLIALFREKFSIVRCNVSIPAGSALAFYCQSLFGNFQNKYVRFAFKMLVSIIVWPLLAFNYNRSSEIAGAFFLIGQNRHSDSASGEKVS